MTTSPDRERELFEACLAVPFDERREFLQQRCGDDSRMRDRVGRLLDAHAVAEDAPSSPVDVWRPNAPAIEQIGPYRILEQIGEGGMGVVYTAEQKEPFRRLVALKVIKVGMDTRQVIARFEVERQALAMMDHPAIARVFDAGATETGRPYFVMEYVQGSPITRFCDQQRMRLRDRLALFMEVCDGVQHAQNRGVVHRDLKPSNVLVTSIDGRPSPKIIDFGVAKATGAKLTSQTVHTAHGTILGTPAYMSPEQADSRSGDVDSRTDVYALGVILYELCVGRLPFDARELESGGLEAMVRRIREERAERPSTLLATRSEFSIEAAERRDTDVATLRRAVGGDLDWIVLKALQKDRQDRYASPSELRADIERYLDERTAIARPASAGKRTARWIQLHLVSLVLAAAVVLLIATRAADDRPAGESRLSVHVPSAASIYSSGSPNLAISPDGSAVAWVGGETRDLYVRRVDAFEVRRLEGTSGAVGPFFSPDGDSIAYFADGALRRISVSSGSSRTIAETGSTALASRGGTWGDDGWIVFGPHFNEGLMRVRAEGGPTEVVTTIDSASGERTHRWPQLLPGCKALIFTVDDDRTQDYYDDASIVVECLATGERRVLLEGASQARYADGMLVFARGGSLYAQPFDADRRALTGTAVEAVRGVETDTSTGAAMFDLSSAGALVHAPGGNRELSLRLVLRGLDGSTEELDLEPGGYQQARLSPDGTRIAFVQAGSGGGDAWVYDTTRRLTSRLTSSGTVRAPIWSPDGERIYFGVNDGDVRVLEVDRDEAAQHIVTTERGGLIPVDLSSDGRRMIAVLNRPGLQWDVVEVDLEAGVIEDVVATAFTEGGADVHPSGNWLAYASDRSGQREIHMTRLPGNDVLYTVSSGGGMDPKWSPDGDALFYVRPGTDQLWVVDVVLDPAVSLGTPRLALSEIYAEEDVIHNFDVGPDGRILALRDGASEDTGREIRVQAGWTDEQRR